jgi:O-acetyl-ADP-ribose deacetylase (regulator of RNase III)
MIIYEKGDLFSQINSVEAIINTVNCVGVMGKGVALEFKKRYPENFQKYKDKCVNKELSIGKSFVYKIPHSERTKFIINFPTKKHWRNPSKIEYIIEGLDDLILIIKHYNIRSVAMPALGCGNGNLDWKIVKPLIEKKLSPLSEIKIIIYEPSSSTNKDLNKNITKKKPRLTSDRKKLLLLMNDYNKFTKGPMVSFIQTHIISYFLNFKNKKMKFELEENGPYQQDVNKIILLLSQYYIKPIESIEPNLPKQIKIINLNFPQKKDIMRDEVYLQVKSLISGFESYDGLLSLSIAHWFHFNENVSIEKLYDRVNLWFIENHYNPNAKLIDKSIKRLERIYDESDNLTLNLF